MLQSLHVMFRATLFPTHYLLHQSMYGGRPNVFFVKANFVSFFYKPVITCQFYHKLIPS